jgi:hypothetical protein
MKVPVFAMLFIACCVTLPIAVGINVLNSIPQFSFVTTKSTTHLKIAAIYPIIV